MELNKKNKKMKYRIKEIAEAKGLTLKALAKQCELSIPSMYNIANGKLSPKVSTLERIAKELGVCITELFNVSSEQKTPNNLRLTHCPYCGEPFAIMFAKNRTYCRSLKVEGFGRNIHNKKQQVELKKNNATILLNAKEAALELNISLSRLYLRVKQGKLKCRKDYRVGRNTICFCKEDIETYKKTYEDL